MATIQSSLQLYDGMSPVLRKITNAMHIAISSFEDMSKASSQPFDTARLNDARRQLNDAEVQINQIDEAMERARKGEEKLNQSMAQGNKEAHGLRETWEKISGTLGMAGIAVGAKEILSGANDKRIAGNTLQVQTGMQGDTLEAAKQSMENLYTDNMGKSLDDVAQSMSKVYQITGQTGAGLEQMTRAGILLRDTFGYEVTESMRTAEMMQKQFGVSGAQAFDLIVQGAQAGLDKNGDLLDTINEYSVQFKKLGFDSTDMFNMLINGAQSGTFSVDKLGDTIKEFSVRAIDGSKSTQEGFKAIGLNANEMVAAFGSGGDAAKQAFQQTINAISSMEDPVKRNIAGINLFGTMWEDLGYEGVMALANINGSVELTTQNLEELNNVKYDDATSALASLGRTINMGLSGVVGSVVNVVTRHMNDFTAGLQGDASQIQGIFGGIGLAVGIIGRAISDNWSIVEPIMWGVIAALAIYGGYLLITNGLELISKGIKIASCIASFAYAVATRQAATDTMKQTAAQLGLNAALLACPITWIIIGIIAIVAALYTVVAWINKTQNTSISATGIICGVFATAGAIIGNVLMGILEVGLGIVEYLVNGWLAFANFFANVFNDPIGSVIHLFADLGDNVLGIIEKIAQAIDFVFGSNLAGAVSGWRDGLSEMANEAAEKYGNGTYEQKYDKFDVDQVMADMGLSMERFNYGDSYKTGYKFGEGIDKKVGGAFDNIKDSFSGIGDNSTIPGAIDGIYNNTGSTAGNTAKMADSMDIMDEDLKYMRDAAEQEIINRFTLAELKVDVKNNNTLTKKTDFDDMGRALSAFTSEFMAAAAEGGHI
ncbi:phage tail tape measure protein [Enterocloster citroniae]|uniref:phage tail tape measure protein n=1 Tax=Enterocloster citroniae TaxID=358743 RepID=UPI0032C0DC01